MALTPFGRRSSLWSPLSFPSFWDPVDTIFDRPWAVSAASFPEDVHAIARTKVDWVETPEAHVFKADLPGLKKEEIKVQLEDGRTLTIIGERTKEETKQQDQWHQVERSSGKFQRRFRLPENAKVDDIRAGVEHGVLTVTVPKVKPTEESAARNIEVTQTA